MAGGLMQLSAYGSQDVYLTGNPQITFFKSVYRRYTNFSMESVEQSIVGTKNFGQRIECKIQRVGDLLTNLHVYFKLPKLADATFLGGAATSRNWTNAIGYALLKQMDLEIGGERIDRQYGKWLDIWNELGDDNGDEHNLVGKVPNPSFKSNQANAETDGSGAATTNSFVHDGQQHLDFDQHLDTEYYVPLRFWFCGNPALALPLIALQHQDIVLKIDLRALNECYHHRGTAEEIVAPSTIELQIYGDYIYLDVDERRKFAESSHEYLIEQLQFQSQSISKSTEEVNLNFNHPCKDLIWVFQHTTRNSAAAAGTGPRIPGDYSDFTNQVANDWFNYNGSAAGPLALAIPGSAPSGGATITSSNAQTASDPFTTASLQFGGRDRFAARPPMYFKHLQPLYHYDNIPSKNVYAYSFALKPTEHQPSGTCNFSRLDNAKLVLNGLDLTGAAQNLTISIFTRNYNVLRISSGVSGLAYNV